MESWRHIPSGIDPIAFTVGPFPIRWYAIFFLSGFLVALLTLFRRSGKSGSPCDRDCLLDLAVTLFAGILLGGRLGFAFLYDQNLLSHPFRLFLPFGSESGAFVGIRGMSFFGGLVGGMAALAWFVRSGSPRFPKVADFLAPAVPIALFFGRIGNFVNGELYGRMTDLPMGMYFPLAPDKGTVLRHPSQLYEAALESLLPLLVLSWAAKRRFRDGVLTALLLFSYALARFFAEFFREPDPGSVPLSGWMTEGQALSVLMATMALLFVVARRKEGIGS